MALTGWGAGQAMSAATAPRGGRDNRGRFEGNTARILVVEDNITNQRVALGILKLLGLSADVVGSGADAVKAVATVPYDIFSPRFTLLRAPASLQSARRALHEVQQIYPPTPEPPACHASPIRQARRGPARTHSRRPIARAEVRYRRR